MSEVLLNIKIEPFEEGGYLATSEDLPELLAQGRTVSEALFLSPEFPRQPLTGCKWSILSPLFTVNSFGNVKCLSILSFQKRKVVPFKERDRPRH